MLETNKIYCADCLDLMKEMEDNSVDLVLTDPPYYQIMKKDYAGNKYDWDNLWKSFDEYLKFIESCFVEFARILKNNGSFYCFADDKIAAYIQIIGDKYFHLENNIIWHKPNNMPIKGWQNFRSYAPVTERILFYSREVEKTGLQEIYANRSLFKPIKEYMTSELNKSGLSKKEINTLLNSSITGGGMACHFFGDTDQYTIPTRDMYLKLQTTGFFKREYEELRREYEELRREYEELRRPFCQNKNYTDVWTIPITPTSERTGHPTQKPEKLIKRIINTSSKSDALVFDPFLGSGTTAVACINTGRNFIGIEKDEDYFEIAQRRIKDAQEQERIDQWF